MDNFDIHLIQLDDKTWNLQKILPIAEEKKEEKKKTSTKPIPWEIKLEDFTLQNSDFTIKTIYNNLPIPKKISNLNIQFDAFYSTESSNFHLNQFSLQTENPSLELEHILLAVAMQNEFVTLDTLEIKTAQNRIGCSLQANIIKPSVEHFILQAKPLKVSEFKSFLPDLPIRILPEILLQAEMQNEVTTADISIEHENQQIQLSIQADSVFSRPVYQVDVNLTHLNGNTWIDNEQLESDLNLQMEVTGMGLKPETMVADLDLLLYESTINSKKIDSLKVQLEKLDDQANLTTNLIGNFGAIEIQGNVSDLFDQMEYHLAGSTKNIDFSSITENDTLKSDINLGFLLEGKGINPKQLSAKVNIDGKPSYIADIELDKLIADITYKKENYVIKQFSLENTLAKLNLIGSGYIRGENEISFEIDLDDLSPLQKMMSADLIEAGGTIKGSAQGELDDLTGNVNLDIHDVKFNEFGLNKLSGEINISKKKEDFLADALINIHQIQAGEFQIESVQLQSAGNLDRIENSLDIKADSLQLHLDANAVLDSTITIELPFLDLQYGKINLQTATSNARFLIDQNRYQIDQLQLHNNQGLINLDGVVAPQGNQDLSILIQNIDLSQINHFNLMPYKIHGNFNFESLVSGKMLQPEVNTKIDIKQFGTNEIDFEAFQLFAELVENKMNANLELIRNKDQKIKGFAAIPIFLDSTLNKEMIPKNELINAGFSVSDFDLAFIKSFAPPIDEFTGKLNVNVTMKNTFEDPKIAGEISLSDGSLEVSEFGLIYPELKFDSEFTNTGLLLNEFYVQGGDGFLSITGKATLQDSIQKGINDFELKIKANQFEAAGKRELYALMDADLSMQGTMQKPTYSGFITIPKARIDLDALQGEKANTVDVNSPLLVQAMKTEATTDSIKVKKEKKQPDILKNLRGKMRFEIPKNTWIRSKDMNIEIAGDLEIIKENTFFELFGYVKTLRGKYQIYGRKFDLKGGTVTFNGGEIPNPFLDLSIKHVFRDISKEKRLLTIGIGGQAMSPIIHFYLDEDEISETDAISYLLFGRSNNEISQGEKSQVSEQSGVAKSIIAKQIGSQIASKIGEKLNLDVIEFSGGDNWKQGSILVGKYLTNDLFLSYQKEFSLGQAKEIVPDKVAIEYEINKHFSVQATRGDEKATGFDVYWKFNLK